MVRGFKEEDLNGVMEIWINANIQAHHFIAEDYWINNFDNVKEILPTAKIYVYEEEKISGFIGLVDGYIAGLFVSVAKQSKGIGKQLLDKAKTEYDKLILNVYEKNTRAFHFYEKHGFSVSSRAIDSNTGEIEIEMSWEENELNK